MKHPELVARAVRWLARSQGCSTVVSFAQPLTWEQPDALGWHTDGQSVLIECKASWADFLRDRQKPFRVALELGAGNRRYYLAPPGLLKLGDVPSGFGLLECHPKVVRMLRDSP